MIEPKTREIDGVTFTVRQLAAFKSLRMLNRLTRSLGPAIAALGASGGKLSFEALTDALSKLGDRLGDQELEAIARELLADATFENPDHSGGELLKQIDIVLGGRPETLIKLLAFALEANYGNFFDALRGLGAGRLGALSSSLNHSPKSGPPSGS